MRFCLSAAPIIIRPLVRNIIFPLSLIHISTKFNLKEMSKTLLFLQEQKIGSAEELRERATAATERYHAMGDSIKAVSYTHLDVYKRQA